MIVLQAEFCYNSSRKTRMLILSYSGLDLNGEVKAMLKLSDGSLING